MKGKTSVTYWSISGRLGSQSVMQETTKMGDLEVNNEKDNVHQLICFSPEQWMQPENVADNQWTLRVGSEFYI